MKTLIFSISFLFLIQTIALGQSVNAVCPDPSQPCQHKQKKFDAWELSFKMPAKLANNKTYSSAKFYAVIAKTYDLDADCGDNEYLEAAETERKKLQAQFPKQKAFASYMCPNLSGVGYEFDGKWDKTRDSVLIDNFIALFAASKLEAEKLLKAIQPNYPDAMIKQMTASYEAMSY